jgi:hypothetical protein
MSPVLCSCLTWYAFTLLLGVGPSQYKDVSDLRKQVTARAATSDPNATSPVSAATSISAASSQPTPAQAAEPSLATPAPDSVPAPAFSTQAPSSAATAAVAAAAAAAAAPSAPSAASNASTAAAMADLQKLAGLTAGAESEAAPVPRQEVVYTHAVPEGRIRVSHSICVVRYSFFLH